MSSGSVAAVAARYRRGMTIAAAVVMWVWHLGNDVPNALATWQRFRPPLVDPAALAVVGVVGVVATWWLWRPQCVGDRPLPPWVLGLVLLATEAVTIAATPRPDRFGAANWIWGAVGWFAIAVYWHRRLADLLAFLGLHFLLCAGLNAAELVARPSALGQFLMVQYGTSALQLAFAVGSRATGSAARWAADASAAASGTAVRRAAAGVLDESRRRRYRTIRAGAREVLTGLASGALDPSDPAVRRSCAIEAARLRRLLAEDDDVPEPLLHELRACADVAERRGVQIEIVAVGKVPDLPAATRRRLADPPLTVLAGTRSRARITVAALPDDVAVSVLADCEPAGITDMLGSSAEAHVEVAHHREGNLLWTQTRWRSRSGSPSSTTTRL